MSLDDAYDPEAFRAAGHRLIDGLAEYLQQVSTRELPVLPARPPGELLAQLETDFARPTGDVVAWLMRVIESSNHVHHPRFVGHQVSAPLPQSILAEAASALLSNGMAIYEMGQMHTAMERQVVRFLARTLGLPDPADGVLTHGGSLGNLTALLAARQAAAGHDVWTEGQREPLSVLVSDQAHYCIARAVRCMGWGAQGTVIVPTDERFRLDARRLPACLARARAAGRRVIAVVASSGSTATGSLDPLPEIADFCAENGLWLHVDGAHGASLALSPRHRHRLAGIERADSVVWDLHKMMGLPALNTAVLFRDGRRSYGAFAQDAAYLFEGEQARQEWFNIGLRTLECTKRGLGVTAYTMLASLGREVFAQNVERLMERAEELAQLLAGAHDFELAHEPQTNILCFRHTPAGTRDLDALQLAVRRRILERERFYVVQAPLGGSLWLRTAIMNPATTSTDLVDLLAEIRTCADEERRPR